MINLDEIIGDIIFISFRDKERFKDIGISTTSGHFLFKGYDQVGLWFAHPGIVLINNEDELGNLLPVTKQTKENIGQNLMVKNITVIGGLNI